MPASNSILQEGRYRLGQVYPNAGDNCVYEAYDTVSETNVVVKEVPFVVGSQPSAIADEARSLTGIDHDSLLRVTDIFSETDKQYLVMELVDGDDMFQLLDRNKNPFPLSDVVAWADQLLDAIHYLHSFRSGMVHADICPANIKLSSMGRVKLQTIGMANHSEVDFNTTISSNTGIAEEINYSPLEKIWSGLDTASQKVIISRYDERSERILKEPLDARSDIYSIGATLYHLMTARRPIDALERSIEILEGKSDPLLSPNKIDKSVPPEISDVIMKAMEIKREYRFDSAAIMRQVLKTAVIRVKERETFESRTEKTEAPKPAKATASVVEDLGDDLLGLHTPQPDPSERSAIKRDVNAESNKAPAISSPAPPIEQIPEPKVVTAKALDAEFVPAEVETPQNVVSLEAEIQFLETEQGGRSGFSFPMIAAVLVAIIAVAAVGWYVMSSSTTEATKPAEVRSSIPTEPSSQPEVKTESPATVTPTTSTATTTVSEPAVPVETAPETSDRSVQRPTAKQKTSERPAAKPSPQKKQVTVDDLINDN